ncbi:ABC transporter ATP-binding protein [Pararobbsia alpina]|uniref:High-affinity branched-chain amino acid transport ATP-binding protein LivF n=1 Tax=Pararobbsia alpina TaxID=621374 RepID=A0A6S7BG49_9BURK|nr:ABC transporter ATP-binding protein [Pararobbsia alpina]CAB3799276.1 High-affinity branched-chain amino acid transport ATP-binding protein LivF [Pararobbsia alpina]
MSILKVRGLEARHGLLQAVRGVDLDLREGERLALVGANGAGKTTLLRTLAGIHPASAGMIEFDGTDVTSVPAYRRAAMGIALVPEGRRLFASMTVAENLQVALSTRRTGRWNLDSVVEAFPQIKPKLKALAGSLSGGQQQAVAIGRALITNPRVLLLDEVSLGLSPAAVQGVYDSLATVVAEGTTLILVEQDLQRTFDVAGRLLCMLEGVVVASGHTDEMTRDEVMAHYFGHHVTDEIKERA